MPDEQLPLPTATDTPAPPPGDADESLSLSDHEQKYSGRQESQPERETKPVETPQAEPEVEPASAETEERDEKGRFLPKKRHRAASQDATPADVPRIRELTARLRAAEAERDALQARATRPDGAAGPVPARPPIAQPVTAKPRPTPDGFDDYGAYVDALTDWKVEQALSAAEAKRQEQEQQRAVETEKQRLASSWTQRVQAAKAKYPDFEEVALLSDTAIPAGSLVDAWILEHKAGAEVLYHLQQHPDEVQSLLALPLFEQAEALTLLSQRFNGSSHGRTAAVATGSAPASTVTPPPKPPNPVRTGALAGNEPPDDEHTSLLDHEKVYQPRRRRGA